MGPEDVDRQRLHGDAGRSLWQRADDLGAKAKAASDEAAAARSALARKLKDEGFTLREMGQVLGVSYQWASELAAG